MLRADGEDVPFAVEDAVYGAIVTVSILGEHRRLPREDVCDWLERIGCSESEFGGPRWAQLRREG